MEGGLPMLNCLLQHTLKSLCSSSDSSDKWAYAVFWRILPRNFPPPKWEYGGGALDLIKGNKRNWILVWEDGYCDFDECARAAESGYFGADVFFKMSHEVYSYGEGLMGKPAADNSHRWVFSGSAQDDPSCFSSWKFSIDPVTTQGMGNPVQIWNSEIALIPVREGMIQLGSLDKITEDPKLVVNTQRKLNYLLSMPGISAIPRPSSITFNIKPTNNPWTIESNGTSLLISEKHQLAGSKRLYSEGLIEPPMWSLPQLYPAWSCNYGPFLSTLPYNTAPYDPITSLELGLVENNIHSFRQKAAPVIKGESECGEEHKSCCLSPTHGLENYKAAKRSRFGTLKEGNLVH